MGQLIHLISISDTKNKWCIAARSSEQRKQSTISNKLQFDPYCETLPPQ
jgi:hypothetical protein